MDADETLCDQLWCLSASTQLSPGSAGLIAIVSGRRFLVNLGSRQLETLVLDGLRTQTMRDAVEQFSRKSVSAALLSLHEVGAIARARTIHRLNLFADDAATSPSLGASDLLLIGASAFDVRLAPLLALAREMAAPCVLTWTAGTSVVLVYDDGAHRPCVGCALLFDTALFSAPPIPGPDRTSLCDVAWAMATQMAAPGAALPEPGRALVLDTSPWRLTWDEFESHPSCPCRTRPRKQSNDNTPRTTHDQQRFAPLLVVQHNDDKKRSAKVLFRRDQEPGAQARPSVGVATAAGDDADIRALAEGVERFCMLHAPTTVSSVTASELPVPALADAAIRSLLFRHEELAVEGFRLQPYAPEQAQEWTLARDALTASNAMIPTSLIGRPSAGHARLVDATSSGYAAHVDSARAAELALLELVERDALLMSWFLNQQTPALDLALSELTSGADTATHAVALLATRDIDIPVVWILALMKDGSLYSASGASLSFDEALKRARRELAAALQRPLSTPLAANPASRLDDVRIKHGPLDHLSYWSEPSRAASLVERMAANVRMRASECSLRWPARREGGGAQDVASILARSGLTAYLVDRSLPDVFGAGWSVVRALVPGIVELSWGQGYRRLASPRIEHLLAQGGKLSEEPHPIA